VKDMKSVHKVYRQGFIVKMCNVFKVQE